MNHDYIQAAGERIIALRKKLAARKGHAAYSDNVKAIEAEIARLEAITLKSANPED